MIFFKESLLILTANSGHGFILWSKEAKGRLLSGSGQLPLIMWIVELEGSDSEGEWSLISNLSGCYVSYRHTEATYSRSI